MGWAAGGGHGVPVRREARRVGAGVAEHRASGEVLAPHCRRGAEHVTRETWTTQRAQRAGYTNNKKYQTDPQAMLYARAASDVCRQIAADVLAGIGHSVEEMQLAGADRPTQAAQPVQTFTAAPVEKVDAATLSDIHDLFDAKGIAPDDQLPGVAYIIGRQVDDLADITADEATNIVERLQAKPDAAPQAETLDVTA